MKQFQAKYSSFALRIKIIIGYVSLVIILGAIVFMVWLEHRKMESLNINELLNFRKREIVNRTFEKLLDFSFSDNFLLLQNNDKFEEYRIKRKVATNVLNELKQYYPAGIQHSQIDKISSLLQEKENLLFEVMNAFSDFSYADSLLQIRIPIIASQEQTSHQQNITEITKKKRGGLFGLFTKKEEKSAYARQREKKGSSSVPHPITGELYSLQKEIRSQYTNYWNKLIVYSDSLQLRNAELNSQLSELINKFEQAALTQAEEEIKEMSGLREQSFQIIIFIAAAALLLIITFYLFIHHDINKRLEYRMKLEASDRLNRELLTARRNLILTVSHDLRAPLSIISEYAELLQDEKDAEQSKGYALNILRASRHVIGLANNLLYYYRLEAEKEQPEKEIFHLGQTIENAVSAFLPLAEKKGLGLTAEVESSDILVMGDAGRLVQILNNLLSNAIKFTRVGYIYVGAQYKDRKLSLFVKDTGIGICKERQAQIFTAFERGETSDAGNGYGLGLTITSKLVALLGGSIQVQSTLGQGSTFSVCLPLEEADGRLEIEKTSSENDSLFPIRVLAIDDDRMQLEAVRKMYARNGIECDCCLNVGELVEALRRNSYDLVLTDIQMSETDGYEVLSLLRGSNIGQSRTIPVLAVTARTDEEKEHFKKIGFADCLYKPFSPNELLAATFGIDRPDFTVILEDEENPGELLQIFIEDTEEELAGMRKVIQTKNYGKLGDFIHKAAPLWKMIRIDIPLSELEYIASLPAVKWNEVPEEWIERLMSAVEKAVEKAKRIKEKTNGEHFNSGR